MKSPIPLLLCLAILLPACTWDGEEVTNAPTDSPPASLVDRGVQDDIPLYYEDSDAKKVSYLATETGGIVITMETINGPLSPMTYYRKIGERGWKIVQDTPNNGGTLKATKQGRTLEVTFVELPGGAGTFLTLVTRD
ncbi:hypothetical protein COU76_01200 [Candidatus Peregrinibacteria bacterium CG10_big_fil_rev_8_21_14_0_10_49_10]|nr:MAG: hypothetical protein COU76_01200 [Candidatus Peregrinibacteria bacterium CG10_big_fil_rev_8_21_14_0_10_49_10]